MNRPQQKQRKKCRVFWQPIRSKSRQLCTITCIVNSLWRRRPLLSPPLRATIRLRCCETFFACNTNTHARMVRWCKKRKMKQKSPVAKIYMQNTAIWLRRPSSIFWLGTQRNAYKTNLETFFAVSRIDSDVNASRSVALKRNDCEFMP